MDNAPSTPPLPLHFNPEWKAKVRCDHIGKDLTRTKARLAELDQTRAASLEQARADAPKKRSPAPRRMPADTAFLTFGPANRLYSEDYFLKALRPLGMSRKGFRAFLKMLRVPTLHIGRTRLIDHLSFSLAMRAIMRVGTGDFLAPGCAMRRRNRTRPTDVTELSNDEFRFNATRLLGELLVARDLANFETGASLRTAAREAASRLLNLSVPARHADSLTRGVEAAEARVRIPAGIDGHNLPAPTPLTLEHAGRPPKPG